MEFISLTNLYDRVEQDIIDPDASEPIERLLRLEQLALAQGISLMDLMRDPAHQFIEDLFSLLEQNQ